MDETEAAQRAAVIAEARSWIGTPYHHHARIKRAGVDCAMLLAEVFERAGVITHVEPEGYSPQWHQNREEEKYLGWILRYAHEIAGPPLPGDIVVWKFGKCFSHGGIVAAWPVIIHAYIGKGCTSEDVSAAPWLSQIGEAGGGSGKPRPTRFFSHWPRPSGLGSGTPTAIPRSTQDTSQPSWPGASRPSTSFSAAAAFVDDRDTPGHDDKNETAPDTSPADIAEPDSHGHWPRREP